MGRRRRGTAKAADEGYDEAQGNLRVRHRPLLGSAPIPKASTARPSMSNSTGRWSPSFARTCFPSRENPGYHARRRGTARSTGGPTVAGRKETGKYRSFSSQDIDKYRIYGLSSRNHKHAEWLVELRGFEPLVFRNRSAMIPSRSTVTSVAPIRATSSSARTQSSSTSRSTTERVR